MEAELGEQGQEFMEQHEHAHGHGHDGHAGGNSDATKHRMRCTILASMYVVAAMIIGMFGHHASNEAIILTVKTFGQYGYFQAKGTKEDLDDRFSTTLEIIGTSGQVDKARLDKAVSSMRTEAEKHAEQKKEILVEAKKLDAEALHLMTEDNLLSYSAAAFGVGTVLAMIAGSLLGMTRRFVGDLGRFLFRGSLLSGLGGVAVLLFALLF